ncbi:hypothetical protein H5410_049494 [Solanum commersonii]|uniref:Uncharacterized protein n=1 Tax=Solanum commersonii TaxID=4109 RepID=A0A9J5WSJ1_SOLCO|nr:hypothetical protein H5410_049494 [Solanum commersonii]
MSIKTLVMESVGPERQTCLFSCSNKPRAACFDRNFSWTPVKNLVMKSFGPEGQMSPFSSSNEPKQVNPYFANFRVL